MEETAAAPRRDAGFSALLGDLVQASKVPAKKRHVSIKSTVDGLTAHAYEKGILPDDLDGLVDLITHPDHLDQASLAALAKNLYPVGKVSQDTALKVIASLGHGKLKPSLAVQALLLRWLILIYHALSKPAILSQAYSVLFNLLDTAAIRPQLGHLLALITRRKHVRPFRIQAILILSRQAGNDPSLVGLLRVYKNYYPEVIVGESTKGKASAFKHPDPSWRVRLDEIQAAHQQRILASGGGPQNGFRVNHQLSRRTTGGRLPTVHTSHAHENSVTLEEIEDADTLALNLEKVELPNQLVAVLADPLLQKFLQLRPEDESYSRINNWLAACISDVEAGDAEPDELMDLVEIISGYVQYTKSLPPMLLNLFQVLFKRWNGIDKRELVLGTVSFTPLSSFDDLYTSTFQLLESRLLDNTPASQLALLDFYTRLLRRWTVSLLSTDEKPGIARPSVSRLVQHVNKLCLTLVQNSPTTSTHLAVLEFYEQFVATFSAPELLYHLQVIIPPPLLVYTLHFSQSVAVLSRLYAALASYKKVLEVLTGRPSTARQLSTYERDQVNTFNGFLMDICNCLWRARAFTNTDTNSSGCRLPQSVVPALSRYVSSVDKELALTSAFGLSHSPALCLQSITFLRDLEDAEAEIDGDVHRRHAGPVTQSSLTQLANQGGLVISWQEYRSGVLRYLEDHSQAGVAELMYNTMKNLRGMRPP